MPKFEINKTRIKTIAELIENGSDNFVGDVAGFRSEFCEARAVHGTG